MPFPLFSKKHSCDSFFTPKEYLKYAKKVGALSHFKIPKGIIIAFQNKPIISLLKKYNGKPSSLKNLYLLEKTGGNIGVCSGFGIGAPAISVLVEELIALGVKKFILVGTAGALQKNVAIGDVVVCTRAIRDEGVSHHYLSFSKYAYPSQLLTSRLKRSLKKNGIPFSEGSSWTIDAPYRETVDEARRYQREGVLTVEMEASAVYAVCEYRKVHVAATFIVSDSLSDLVWEPHFEKIDTSKTIQSLYETAINVLSV